MTDCIYSRRDEFGMWRVGCQRRNCISVRVPPDTCPYCKQPVQLDEGTSDYPGWKKVGQQHFGHRADLAMQFARQKMKEGYGTKTHRAGNEYRIDWFESTGET